MSLELGHHGEHVEQQAPDRVGLVVHGAAEVELDLAAGEIVDDVARVGQRAGEPVELGHDERVAGAAGGERLAQAGTVAVGAGEAVVDVDALGGHAQRFEAGPLGGEVLFVGGDARVADQHLDTPGVCPVCRTLGSRGDRNTGL
jgi:hypothetical protein